MTNAFYTRFLSPESVELSRGKGGVLEGVIEGETYNQVVLTRTFPLSKPSEYISLAKPDGEEIGIIKDIAELDTISLSEAELELSARYLIPVVTRINKITAEPGFWKWELETDRGPLELIMPNLHEHVQTVEAGRLLITDMNGRRCEIRQIASLDSHSKKQLGKIT